MLCGCLYFPRIHLCPTLLDGSTRVSPACAKGPCALWCVPTGYEEHPVCTLSFYGAENLRRNGNTDSEAVNSPIEEEETMVLLDYD